MQILHVISSMCTKLEKHTIDYHFQHMSIIGSIWDTWGFCCCQIFSSIVCCITKWVNKSWKHTYFQQHSHITFPQSFQFFSSTIKKRKDKTKLKNFHSHPFIFAFIFTVTISKAAILGIALGALVILLMILVAACRPHNPTPFLDGSLDKPGT